jgi:hypothetical protein
MPEEVKAEVQRLLDIGFIREVMASQRGDGQEEKLKMVNVHLLHQSEQVLS